MAVAEAGAIPADTPGIPRAAALNIKVRTPQIHWHGRFPVFTVDFHPHFDRLCATGGQEPDGSGGVHLWIVNDGADAEETPVRFVQELAGHEKTVNCLRFSPSGDMLATAGTRPSALADPFSFTFHAMLRASFK